MFNAQYISLVLIIVSMFYLVNIVYAQKNNSQMVFPYNLSQPNEKHILPGILEEISGHDLLNNEIMICIQDEEGDLFFYNMAENRLIKRVDFAKDADYEDMVKVNDVVYVLRSNGTIYKLEYFEDEEYIKTKEIKTRLSKKNNCEGLCYDPVENRLLIALKGNPEVSDDQDFEGYKAIYAFDMEKEKVLKKPQYLINLKLIKDMEAASLYERISHQIAGVFEESGDIRFQPSALAIHPIRDEIYMLASVGKVIIVINRNGDLIWIEPLDKWLFVQPEGMTFAPDGTLYISSEGDGGNGILMKFEMKK